MRKLRLVLICAGLALVYALPIFMLPGFAAAYLKFGDITGESTAENHQEEIDVLTWNWNVTKPSTSIVGGSRDTGPANVKDFSFTHDYDKASPLLALRCFDGQATDEVVLTVDRSVGAGETVEYLIIRFFDVLVTSVAQTNDATAGTVPLETVTFNFLKVELKYMNYDSGGKSQGDTQFEWNIETNKGS